eukprot:SAG31_NODE_22803_length_517_cov_1.208134_1_plen_50_part_01
MKSSGLKAALKALGVDAKGSRAELSGRLNGFAVNAATSKTVQDVVAKQLR